MGFDKGHHEFHSLDMQAGWHRIPGYPPGFSEKILAGALDERNKRGTRTRRRSGCPTTGTSVTLRITVSR